MYTCGGSTANQIAFKLRIVNPGPTSIPWSGITIRYWLTATDPLVMECDYASEPVACSGQMGTFVPVTPAKPTANQYLELSFPASAGNLDAFRDVMNDTIQLRVHTAAYTNIDQTDDYSLSCASTTTEIENDKITAYIGGQLAFGTEPP
jgi:hypothetical protein